MKLAFASALTLLFFIENSAVAAVPNRAPDGSHSTVATAGMTAATAEEQVRKIVNGPITHLPRTDEATVFSPGWFHPGATIPDYDNVDVRASQDLSYKNSRYVTSDLNPSEMFIGKELEFNPNTKYYYTDRNFPKKRLTDDEMEEINRLYRIIGHEHDRKITLRYELIGLALFTIGALAVIAVIYRRL